MAISTLSHNWLSKIYPLKVESITDFSILDYAIVEIGWFILMVTEVLIRRKNNCWKAIIRFYS